MIKQPFFVFQTATISNQLSILAYNTMTGNYDSYGILAVGNAHCPDTFDITNAERNGFIRDGCSVRDC